MSDGDFDPCECVWSHDMAMRRLVSLLRQSQSYCTDSECFNETPNDLSQGGLGNDMVLMTVFWTMVAFLLFYLRPASLRGASDSKPHRPQGGGSPPAAPPTS